MTLHSVITGDGSSTLFVPELNEHYHSTHGAIAESTHIFISEGFDRINKFPAHIFEMGFGTGLNAFLTLLEAEKKGKEVHYTTIEKFPLEANTYRNLNYPVLIDPLKSEIFSALHEAPWNTKTRISNHFVIYKIPGDLQYLKFKDSGFDLVYFDAFGPDVQPELWTEEIFKKLCTAMTKSSSLVTYSVKGTVKRALKVSGFTIEKLPGPIGKREILRATKIE
jgi:tRNA U34 5-methylaminomethyl-2-thiouridine-forming methyltransferase MnmC